MKVNTFIVGAPKAGTTSLHFYLSQHKDVCMSTIKEPNYFSSSEVQDLYYDSPILKSTSEYNKLFEKDSVIKGESSVSYLYYEKVPQRINEYNPDAKIIIMLRNPSERLFSHYLMDKRLGFCSKSIQDIHQHRSKYALFFQQFFKLGNYHEQIKRYQNIFGSNKVLILFYDDFKKDTRLEVEKVFKFLGIEPQLIDLEIKNQMLSPNNSFVAFLYTIKKLRKLVNFLIPTSLISLIKSNFFQSSKTHQFSQAEYNLVKNYYENEIILLEELLKKDLSAWKK